MHRYRMPFDVTRNFQATPQISRGHPSQLKSSSYSRRLLITPAQGVRHQQFSNPLSIHSRYLCISVPFHQAQAPASNANESSRLSKQSSAFDLFPATLSAGPPPASPFHIDLSALRREFLQLQARTHPDRHADTASKAQAERTSAALNNAYRTLTDPLARAREVLQIRAGIDLENDESAKEEDQELLMVVLEAREVIEEAEAEEDLETLRVDNEDRIRQSEDELGRACETEDWDGAKNETVRLRYWRNIREAVQGWEKGRPTILTHS